ncbi:hypothetical protein PISMIDRAFT_674312 [Pisolithus microcarpus 441]|uniref:Secreted protein n=1 Tax=Pisolithus microcarpus 441 TaxID=765257 RepID=A0A0D0A7E1_9AGAM|nr:hypothetical protein PISMIDRAFT_674312 [Pisolithus microcarpus 441]
MPIGSASPNHWTVIVLLSATALPFRSFCLAQLGLSLEAWAMTPTAQGLVPWCITKLLYCALCSVKGQSQTVSPENDIVTFF